MQFKSVLFFLCFLLSVGFFKAKSQSISREQSLSNMSVRQWTTQQGLSSNNITDIHQDQNGLIWITTFNGFIIYDSETFEIYDINTLDLLSTDGFYKIVESEDGTIYLGSQGSGIITYKEGVFSTLETKDGEVPKLVRAFHLTEEGDIYAGTNGDGAYSIRGDRAEKIGNSATANLTIRSLLKDSKGNLWLGSEGNGLFKIKDDSIRHITVKQGLLNNNINQISEVGETIYLASNNGMQIMDSQGSLVSISELEGLYINCFTFDEENTLWLGTENGLFRWHIDTKTLQSLYSLKGVDLVRITSVKMDQEGSLWVGSSRSGLIQFRESKVENFVEPDLSSERVYIVKETQDGKLLIGSDKDVVDIFDAGKFNKLSIKTDLKGNGIRDIEVEKDGEIWLATYRGIIRLSDGQETLFDTKWGMPANNFRVILKDDNYLWFGSRSGGIVKFKNDKIEEIYDINNKLKSNFILAMVKDQSGNIYVGTHSGGMTIFFIDGRIETYNVKQDDSGVLIFNIDPYETGKAYITTNLGPAHFDGKKITPVKLQQDRVSKTYFDIVDDQQGSLWITSNAGILRIARKDWFDFLEGRIDDVSYFLLDESSGMNNKECTGATRSTLGSDGRIYFPTLGGISIVDPKDFNENSQVSKTIIRHLYCDNAEYLYGSSDIELPPGSLRIKFDFATTSFQNPDRNQYKYSLVGFDNGWSNPSFSSSVEYTNLRPGNYTFEVIGSSDGKNWNSSNTSISFKVLPRFHQTISFYLISILTILGVIYGVYRWRISFINRQNQRLKKVNEELDRFVYSASHELRSPLSSVIGLVQYAKTETTISEIKEYLFHIENSVTRMDGLIADIIDYSRNARTEIKMDVINLNVLIQEVIEGISFTEYFRKINFHVEDNSNGLLISDQKRVKIVLSNIITNAFKHHDPENIEDPYIRIDIQSKDDGEVVKISDNGPGIEQKVQKDIFKMFFRATVKSEGSGLGLYIVNETMGKLKGTVDLDSTPGKGTAFTLFFPNLDSESN